LFGERGKTRLYARGVASLIARVVAVASRLEARGVAITGLTPKVSGKGRYLGNLKTPALSSNDRCAGRSTFMASKKEFAATYAMTTSVVSTSCHKSSVT
jgi:hypothetical protein